MAKHIIPFSPGQKILARHRWHEFFGGWKEKWEPAIVHKINGNKMQITVLSMTIWVEYNQKDFKENN